MKKVNAWYSLVAWDVSQNKTTRSNPPTRSVARKDDPEVQPITASLLIFYRSQ